jgi:hypothetical protein
MPNITGVSWEAPLNKNPQLNYHDNRGAFTVKSCAKGKDGFARTLCHSYSTLD